MNIYTIFEQYKDNVALIDGERSITYKQFLSMIKANSRKLRELNYTKGDKVILCENSQMEFVVLFFSLLSVGCWVVPVQSTITQNELDTIVEELNARMIATDFMNIYEETDKEEELFEDMDNCGILHLTSGTTGKPKFCVRTLRGLLAEAEGIKSTFSIDEGERFMSLPPMSHSFALGAVVMTALAAGSCICTTSKFMPAIALQDIEKYKVTFLVCVPFMAKVMISTRVRRQYDLSRVRVALVGAGAITEDVYNGFYQRFGVVLKSNYGSTETGCLISRIESQPYNAIGKPHDGVDVRILDSSSCEVKPDEVGEMWVKSEGMFTGYYNQNDNVFSEDGYFSMGDLATRDENGNIYIVGRKKWLVNIAGKKVNPLEVEEVLKKYDGVDECVVIGVTREEKEDMIIAFFTGQQIPSSKLIEHCGKCLSSYKVPKKIVFIEEMPKNKSGKIDRNALLQKYSF